MGCAASTVENAGASHYCHRRYSFADIRATNNGGVPPKWAASEGARKGRRQQPTAVTLGSSPSSETASRTRLSAAVLSSSEDELNATTDHRHNETTSDDDAAALGDRERALALRHRLSPGSFAAFQRAVAATTQAEQLYGGGYLPRRVRGKPRDGDVSHSPYRLRHDYGDALERFVFPPIHDDAVPSSTSPEDGGAWWQISAPPRHGVAESSQSSSVVQLSLATMSSSQLPNDDPPRSASGRANGEGQHSTPSIRPHSPGSTSSHVLVGVPSKNNLSANLDHKASPRTLSRSERINPLLQPSVNGLSGSQEDDGGSRPMDDSTGEWTSEEDHFFRARNASGDGRANREDSTVRTPPWSAFALMSSERNAHTHGTDDDVPMCTEPLLPGTVRPDFEADASAQSWSANTLLAASASGVVKS